VKGSARDGTHQQIGKPYVDRLLPDHYGLCLLESGSS
jgi:hypothetical protein